MFLAVAPFSQPIDLIRIPRSLRGNAIIEQPYFSLQNHIQRIDLRLHLRVEKPHLALKRSVEPIDATIQLFGPDRCPEMAFNQRVFMEVFIQLSQHPSVFVLIRYVTGRERPPDDHNQRSSRDVVTPLRPRTLSNYSGEILDSAVELTQPLLDIVLRDFQRREIAAHLGLAILQPIQPLSFVSSPLLDARPVVAAVYQGIRLQSVE